MGGLGLPARRCGRAGRGACRGSLKPVYHEKVSKAVKRQGKKRARHRTGSLAIGKGNFSIKAGGHVTLHVKLTANGMKLVKMVRRRGLKVTVKGTDIETSQVALKVGA